MTQQTKQINSAAGVVIRRTADHMISLPLSAYEAIVDCDLVLGGMQGRRSPSLRSVVRPEMGYRVDHDEVVLPAGLAGQIRHLLGLRGTQVVMDRSDSWPRVEIPPLCVTEMELMPAPQQRFILASQESLRFHARVEQQADADPLIVAMAKVYPDSRFLVLERTRRDAVRRARSLRQSFPSGVMTAVEYLPASKPAILVESPETFSGRNIFDFDVLVGVSGRAAVTSSAMRQIAAMFRSRRIALLPAREGLPPIERMRIDAQFGPRCSWPSDEFPASYGTEVFFVVVDAEDKNCSRNGLDSKRQYLWHCVERNKLIAQLARSVRSGHIEAMQLYCPTMRTDMWAAELGRPIATLVLVESPEHARALRKLLPGWDFELFPDDAKPLIAARTVATIARTRCPVVQADVVIYAAGVGRQWAADLGAGEWHYPPRIVFDVVGEVPYMGRAWQDVTTRLHSYRGLGWEVHVTPVFVRTNPVRSVDARPAAGRPMEREAEVRKRKEVG
jgi:hypothetical protein